MVNRPSEITRQENPEDIKKPKNPNDVKSVQSIKHLKSLDLNLESPRILEAIHNLGLTV